VRDTRGRWLPGPDRGRHRLTKEERRRGFAKTAALVEHGLLSARWLAGRIKTTCPKYQVCREPCCNP
jgi:hypothetical protein